MRKEVINYIFKIAKEEDAFDKLEKFVSGVSKKELLEVVIECGIIPEMFVHDSSEEKLWAKFSDIMLSHSLNHIGIKSKVLGTRGNSADVYGETNKYTIVGDAKTSRLSNTHLNPKDFKVAELDTWRTRNSYAVIVASLLKYPSQHSQVYSNAIEKNVTLLSFTHLNFLIKFYKKHDLHDVWEIGNILKRKQAGSEHKQADKYWKTVDEIVSKSVGKKIEDIELFKQKEISRTKEIGKEGISYWKNEIKRLPELPREKLVRRVIKAEKIYGKIKTIEKNINKYE